MSPTCSERYKFWYMLCVYNAPADEGGDPPSIWIFCWFVEDDEVVLLPPEEFVKLLLVSVSLLYENDVGLGKNSSQKAYFLIGSWHIALYQTLCIPGVNTKVIRFLCCCDLAKPTKLFCRLSCGCA